MISNAQKTKKAFQDGTLFAHMFEFDVDQPEAYSEGDIAARGFKGFFDVLKNVPQAEFRNMYHQTASRPEGFVGLPSTMLKKNYPVTLFAGMSTVGVLFNGNDEQNVTPLLVNVSDSWSGTRQHCINYFSCEMPESLQKAQGLRGEKTMVFHLPETLPMLTSTGRKALPLVWEHINELGWDRYTARQQTSEGMNEVTLAAKLKGVSGLVVYKDTRAGHDPEIVAQRYRQSVADAAKLRNWLSEQYPQEFAKPLPVFFYDPECKKSQLSELSEEQLKTPTQPPQPLARSY